MKSRLVGLFFALVLVLFAFRVQLFVQETITSGDWPYFFQEAAKQFPISVVDYKAYNGLGQGSVVFTALESYYESFGRIIGGNFGWRVYEQWFYILPLVILLVISSYFFTRSAIGVIIFSLNTYILMIVGGGQFGVGFAYAFSAVVVYSFMRTIDLSRGQLTSLGQSRKYIGLAGITLGMQVAIDIRIALVTSMVVFSYFIFSILTSSSKVLRVFLSCSSAVFIALLCNVFWLFPIVRYHVGLGDHGNPQDFLPGIVSFLSFADFSHALSLLHPNWPDNIFGKTAFLQPEFLVLPILAFGALGFFHIRMKSKIDPVHFKVLFFVCIGILGAFLSKGSKDPFGEIYLFLYTTIPGFVVFRDPTKFYILTVISYTYLIPLTLSSMASYLQKKFSNGFLRPYVPWIPYGLFFVFFLFMIRPVIFSEMKGTFQMHPVPSEYISLKNFLVRDKSFYRIMWAPMQSRYGYTSINQPGLSSDLVFRSSSPEGSVKQMISASGIKLLRHSAVKYVVVPTDPQGEFFLTDRRYDDSVRKNYIKLLAGSKDLKRLKNIGDLVIFELPDSFPHFSLSGASRGRIEVLSSGPERYDLSLSDIRDGDRLIVSEGYSHLWQLRADVSVIKPDDADGIMSFHLPASERTHVNATLVYLPSENTFAIVISISGILIGLILIVFDPFKKIVRL